MWRLLPCVIGLVFGELYIGKLLFGWGLLESVSCIGDFIGFIIVFSVDNESVVIDHPEHIGFILLD